MSSFDVLQTGTPDEERIDGASDISFALQSDVDMGDAAIAEAAKTDSAAFGDLYERYYVRIYRYVYHRVGHASDAEDLTAVIFMKALEALPTYQSRRNGFAPWIFRIARNSVVDFYRRQRKQTPLEDSAEPAHDGDPVAEMLHGERRRELYGLLRHLSPEQRDVVLMRYGADLSFGEIASALDKNEAAIRMLLHRGLRKLRIVIDHE